MSVIFKNASRIFDGFDRGGKLSVLSLPAAISLLICLGWPEHGPLPAILKGQPVNVDAKAWSYCVLFGALDPAEHAHPGVKIDQDGGFWDLPKSERRAATDDPAAARFAPTEVTRSGIDAHRTRQVLESARIAAELEHEPASSSAFPKGRRINVSIQ
jgi:hypothetical protein